MYNLSVCDVLFALLVYAGFGDHDFTDFNGLQLSNVSTWT